MEKSKLLLITTLPAEIIASSNMFNTRVSTTTENGIGAGWKLSIRAEFSNRHLVGCTFEEDLKVSVPKLTPLVSRNINNNNKKAT